MKILFKHKRLSQEWPELLRLNPKLVMITLRVCQMFGGVIEITEIFRTEAMQRRYYPNDPVIKSVHQYWRGIDISLHTVAAEKVLPTIAGINASFPYGKGEIKTALVHDIGMGNHLHLQVIDGGIG